ncbi:nucleotide-binding protein [Roseomonas mucosa]
MALYPSRVTAVKQHVIMLSSPKGGVGKSSLARNLAVLAARAGHQVVGIDYDQQATFSTWTQRRERVRASIPGLTAIPVIAGQLDNWQAAMKRARAMGAGIIMVDTPPSLELNISGIVALAGNANLILVPCQQTQDDVDSAAPWMARLIADKRTRAAFVLNRSNRRAKSFSTIRAKLLAVGPVCPVEVPQLEEIPLASGKGLGVMDLSRPASGEVFESLWSYTAREIGL